MRTGIRNNLTNQVRGIAKVVTAVAQGDLKRKLFVEAKGEIAELADTINNMIDTLATFAEQVTTVAREVGTEGKLGGQSQVPGAAGTWRDLNSNVNQLAATLTTQLRAISDVATAVTKGDLTRSITVEAQGEVAQLKDTINEMIRNLRDTTLKNSEQDWLKTNLTNFTRMLQGQRDLMAVGRMILSCSNEISAKNLRVQIKLEAIGHRIRADAARLQQVFWNLIKNAVKFTPPNGQLHLRSSNPQNSWFRLEVVDSGIGIASDVLPRIFDPFEQGGTTGSGGLGLGLTISKAIVELHEGRIFASSAGANRGATFVIELPNVVPSSADSSSSKIEAQPSAIDATQDVVTRPRILLVDDHLDSIGRMQLFLQAIGYHVTTAESVKTALQAVAQEGFDLLVSDIGLPDGSGEDLIRQLREKGHNLPGIALSGYGMQQDIERSRAAGFQVHLIKPVSPQQLQTTIDQLINKQRREAERNSE